jgi:hypothetical protein
MRAGSPFEEPSTLGVLANLPLAFMARPAFIITHNPALAMTFVDFLTTFPWGNITRGKGSLSLYASDSAPRHDRFFARISHGGNPAGSFRSRPGARPERPGRDPRHYEQSLPLLGRRQTITCNARFGPLAKPFPEARFPQSN